MSQSGGEKRRTPKGTRQLTADVLVSLREMSDADAKVTGQHNMRARLVTLGLEMLAALKPKERQTLALRCVHRGDDATARDINRELWPVAAMAGLDALPERSRALLIHALSQEETREAVVAWLEGFSGSADLPPSAPPRGPAPDAPRVPPSSGKRPSSSRSRRGTGPRKGR